MNIAPHTWQSLGSPFTIEGQPPADSAQQPFCLVESVSPDYFRAMRIPLVDGRGITALDGPDAAPVAVISQALARRYFPNENPLGRRIKLKIGAESLTVVGVAADYHQHIYDRQAAADFVRAIPPDADRVARFGCPGGRPRRRRANSVGAGGGPGPGSAAAGV